MYASEADGLAKNGALWPMDHSHRVAVDIDGSNVRFRGKSGNRKSGAMSAFDPKRTLPHWASKGTRL